MVVYGYLGNIDILIQKNDPTKRVLQDAILGGLSVGQVCQTICSHLRFKIHVFCDLNFYAFMIVIQTLLVSFGAVGRVSLGVVGRVSLGAVGWVTPGVVSCGGVGCVIWALWEELHSK